MKTFVLCKDYPEMYQRLFICGNDPRWPTFDHDLARAATFPSPEDAIAFRDQMGHQLGGTDKYAVHELLSDGELLLLGY
jgi:hypothetical protein